jgi:hypothetical protein
VANSMPGIRNDFLQCCREAGAKSDIDWQEL